MTFPVTTFEPTECAWTNTGSVQEFADWPAFADWIEAQRYPDKYASPLIKPGGRFRNNTRGAPGGGGLLTFCAVSPDYDGLGSVEAEEAAARLEANGVKAVIVPTHNHWKPKPGKEGTAPQPPAPRYRIIVPLSREYDASEFARFTSLANGAVGGITDDTGSWETERGYAIGAGHPMLRVSGQYLDLVPGIVPIDRPGRARKANWDLPPVPPEPFQGYEDRGAKAERDYHVEKIRGCTEGRNNQITGSVHRIARFVAGGRLDEVATLKLLTEAAIECGDDPEVDENLVRRQWAEGMLDPLTHHREALECGLPEVPVRPVDCRGNDAPPTEDIEPVDLFGSFAPPLLPRGLLPPVIEQFAFGQGEYMGADPAGVAMAALTVCAAALPDSAKLRVKSGGTWAESARLWSALIGTPSTKKSPIINAAARPLKRIDGEMSRSNATAMTAYKSMTKEEREATPPPPRPRLRLEDVTIEAAGEVLKDSPDGLLILQDELSGWFGSMEKYSGSSKGAAKDRGFWLQAFNGDDHTITRVGRGDVYIPNLSVCLLGGIQPEAIRAVAATSSDDGLLQRLCPILLQPAAVGREEERDAGAALAYETLIQRLHGMRGGVPYTFDAGAQALRRELEEEHFKWQKGFERINGRLASHIGKYDGIFARLCLLFHCCESDGYVIATDTAQRVGRFLHGFLMRHAIGFYADVLGLSSAQDEIEDTAGFILAHELSEMDARIGKSRVRSLRGMKPHDIIRVLEQLEGLGWLIPTDGPRPTSRKWNVNPVVHVRFAERASEEAERRRSDGEMLREIFAAAA